MVKKPKGSNFAEVGRDIYQKDLKKKDVKYEEWKCEKYESEISI